ncbi:hypothetical protein [Rhodococcus baikonurensis]|uniref:hypothetical protein n=1 Tax=Rhodococcus baikonurensis TaxID=172041 RepID=UPI00366B9BD4
MESQEMTTPQPLTCTACGESPKPAVDEKCSSLAEMVTLPPGWTSSHGEAYCPICADVRARTWGLDA